MRGPARTVATLGLAVLGVVFTSVLISPARADDAPALERVHAALATAKHDLEEERARTESARADAARLTSAAQTKRDAASGRLDRARATRRDLGARDAALRAEIERLTTESEALENDLGPARDLCRRLAADLATRDAPGTPAQREARATRVAALVRAADDTGADLGSLADATLSLLRDDQKAASRALVTEDDVEIDGRGRVRGRRLTIGPHVWFLGADGTEAMPRRASGHTTAIFVATPDEGIARAFAAFDQGERTLELPVDAAGEAAGAGAASIVRRSVELLRQGGLAILPLAILSVLSVLVLVERLLAGRRILSSARARVQALATALAADDVEGARRQALASGALGRAFLLGLEGPRDRDRIARAAEASRAAVSGELRARLWLLGTVGASAPFVGLFGTVVGIVRAFEDIARTGAAGFNVVAGGIAEALVATAAGIVVAVFAVVAYNALQAWSAASSARLGASVEAALERRTAEPAPAAPSSGTPPPGAVASEAVHGA